MRVGFPLHDIDHAIRAVLPRPVPGSPGCLLGTINVAGEPLALFDTRKLLGLPQRPLRSTDRILLARAAARCAFLVDDVIGLLAPRAIAHADSLSLRAVGLRGVACDEHGTVLLRDLRRVLSLERAIAVAVHG